MKDYILRMRSTSGGHGEMLDGSDSDLSSEQTGSGRACATAEYQTYNMAYHEVDPSDGDVFTDAFYAPLHTMFLDAMRGGPRKPRCADYAFITVFLVLNICAQLAIAYKVTFLTDDFYGSKGVQLFNNTCWRINPERSDMYNILLPSWMHEESHDKFDCGQPLVTLSLFPERLDLNKDGFWSMTEATEIMDQLRVLGVETSDFPAALQRMIKYDARQAGSVYFKDKIDLSFFQRHKRDIRMCVPTDPAHCANLEAEGHLTKSFSVDLDPDERVSACRSVFHDFCEAIYGQLFISYYLSTQGICGAPSYQLKSGVNTVKYQEVAIYSGKNDSEFGPRFIFFLALLLLIWTLIMLDEFRKIFQFIEVVWRTPTTPNEDEPFATLSDDGKMQVSTLPFNHKAYALGVIASARFILAFIIFFAGTNFLALTDNLLDLILNCTALGFLIEIDNLIHHAFLGAPFTKVVTDKCEALKVRISSDRMHPTSIFYLVVVLCAIPLAITYFYKRRWGIYDIGHATECLCNIAGDCLAARLIVPNSTYDST